jgi:D-alanyl-D-alanine carboxypeptidase
VIDFLPQPVVGRIPFIADVTVAQLLDHGSGIYPTNNDPAYISTLVGRDALTKRIWSPLELIELATRPENKPTAKPGEGHHYSDTNYVLLGLIAEQLTHEPLKQHLARTLLGPLGMNNTYFYSDVLAGSRTESANLASGYIKLTTDLTKAVSFNPGFTSPRPGLLNADGAAERIDAAGGLITTLPDLHRFASALFRGRLLSAKSQARLIAVQAEMAGAAAGKNMTRALQGAMTRFGFVLYKEGDGPGGFNTLMAYHPDTDTIFIGYTNQFGDFDEVDTLMTEVMNTAIPRKSATKREP